MVSSIPCGSPGSAVCDASGIDFSPIRSSDTTGATHPCSRSSLTMARLSLPGMECPMMTRSKSPSQSSRASAKPTADVTSYPAACSNMRRVSSKAASYDIERMRGFIGQARGWSRIITLKLIFQYVPRKRKFSFYLWLCRGFFLFQHEFQHLLGRGCIPHRSKGLPMQRRRPILPQTGDMMRRAVALIGSEPVHGKNRVPLAHHAIAFHFGEDGSRGDGGRKCVAVDNRRLRAIKINAQCVDQQMVGNGHELPHRLHHSEFRGVIDIDLIDARRIHR